MNARCAIPAPYSLTNWIGFCRRWGFEKRQPGGGSRHYLYSLGGITLTVPRHGAVIKPVYVRRVMEALGALGFPEEENDDGNEDPAEVGGDRGDQ